jgi:hypothetical protein
MDITGLVESLKQKNAWDEKRVRVAFLPRAGVEGKAAKHDPITVGRISIYQA